MHELGSMTTVALRRWTREEYERMVDAGILGPNDKVELIDGEIVILTPQKSRHATGVQLALDKLRDLFGDGFVVRSQLPLALDADSEPEPDVAVVVGSVREFVDAHPVTAVLVVEVADTTLAFDRTTKVAVYARTGIADYWIVNLVDRVVEVHRDPQIAMPSGSRFASVQVLRNGDVIAPLAKPDRRIAVADLLP